MASYITVVSVAFYCFCLQAHALQFWIVPNGAVSDFTQNFPANTPLELQWNGQPAVESIGGFNTTTTQITLFDLYVQQYSSTNTFSQLIIGNVNLTDAGSVRWNVSIPDNELAIRQNYVLRFLTAPGDHTGFSSPGFLIQGSSSTTTTSSTTSPTTSSTASPTSSGTQSATSTPTNAASGLGIGAMAGIGIAAPVAVLALAVGLVYMFLGKRKAVKKSDDDFLNALEVYKYHDTRPPSYLEMANRQQPVELPNDQRPYELHKELSGKRDGPSRTDIE
ncbi:uncharacterized protein PAC_14617 [Phialocephala subalpina]|uniref:Mid2 domain-containing protein n=1 Tax=Phialocephala subalpina TaxID=576137 RepID=A0A1L7XI77_9HELO|nr:uncharacterized protein PAC_14617 [Phialocephala subalpina]